MYKKNVYVYKDERPLTVIYDSKFGSEEYQKECDRINKAIVNRRIKTHTTYYIGDIPTLDIMTN